MVLIVPGTALADNAGVQLGVSQALGAGWINNDFDVAIGGSSNGPVLLGHGGGSGSQAVANCQLLLSVNAIVLNVVSVGQLGLISDNDQLLLEGFPFFGRMSQASPLNHVTTAQNGTASCNQDIGPIRVFHAAEAGWGEAAPLAAHADAMADTLELEIIPPPPGGGGSSTNAIVQLGVAAGLLADVITNEVDVEINSGSANAVSSCQILIGWNLLAMNVAQVAQETRIADDDLTDLNLTLPILAEAKAGIMGEHTEPAPVVLAGEGGTSHCRQWVESITLVVGTPDDVFEPES